MSTQDGDNMRERDAPDDRLNANALSEALQSQLESLRALNAALVERHRQEVDELRQGKARAEASVQARFAETAYLTKTLVAQQELIAAHDHELKTVRLHLHRMRDEAQAQAAQFAEAQQLSELAQRSRLLKFAVRVQRVMGRLRGSETNVVLPPGSGAELVAQSGLFDPVWYMTRYPDIAEAGVDPLQHFMEFGGAEGRDPSAEFSSSDYLKRYPDIAETGGNPLLHYLEFGRVEGRTANRSAAAP